MQNVLSKSSPTVSRLGGEFSNFWDHFLRFSGLSNSLGKVILSNFKLCLLYFSTNGFLREHKNKFTIKFAEIRITNINHFLSGQFFHTDLFWCLSLVRRKVFFHIQHVSGINKILFFCHTQLRTFAERNQINVVTIS